MHEILSSARPYMPRLKPYKPHAVALLFFALLGGLSGLLQAVRQPTNPNVKETWAVPDWSVYHVGDQRQQLAELEIWDGKKVALKVPVQVKSTWQFVGTVRKGKVFTAVIELGGETKRIQRAVAGDVLPNGEKILAVENGMLQIDANGIQQDIRLFQQEKK